MKRLGKHRKETCACRLSFRFVCCRAWSPTMRFWHDWPAESFRRIHILHIGRPARNCVGKAMGFLDTATQANGVVFYNAVQFREILPSRAGDDRLQNLHPHGLLLRDIGPARSCVGCRRVCSAQQMWVYLGGWSGRGCVAPSGRAAGMDEYSTRPCLIRRIYRNSSK